MPWVIGGAMIGSAVLGGVGSALSGRSSAAAAERNYKHRYQWQVKDLQKAGLNPMLAVSHGAPNVPQPTFPDVGSAAVEAGSRGASAASAVQVQRSVVDTNKAQAAKTMAEGAGIEQQNLIRATSPEYQGALKAIGAEGQVGQSAVSLDRWNAEMGKITAETENLRSANELQRLDAQLRKGQVSLQEIELKYADDLKRLAVDYERAMTEAAKNDIPRTVAEAKYWETVGVGGIIAEKVKSLIPGIGHVGSKTIVLPKR